MKVYIDGKEVKCEEVKVVVDVPAIEGVGGELFDSDLEYVLHPDGMDIQLIEVTESSAPSAECTHEFFIQHDDTPDWCLSKA